jgi:hypothetical protein
MSPAALDALGDAGLAVGTCTMKVRDVLKRLKGDR